LRLTDRCGTFKNGNSYSLPAAEQYRLTLFITGVAVRGRQSCGHLRDYNDGMASVGIRDLKTHASDIIERAEAGEAFLVTRRGKPVAVVLPFTIEAEDLILGRASPFVRLRQEGRAELREGKTVGWQSLKTKVLESNADR
jgi:prevent-host-death family protein